MHLTYMTHHVTFLHKSPLAQGAGKGFLSCVTPHVHAQVTWGFETFPANLARVSELASWLLSSMNDMFKVQAAPSLIVLHHLELQEYRTHGAVLISQ